MKKTTNLSIMILFASLIIVSCNRPSCENKNPIFNKYDIHAVEYKTELINQIEKNGQENLTYWLNSYVEENGQEYIIVDIQNDSLCAKGVLKVNDWNNIEEIKRTKGKSYMGAELKGLVFSVEKDSNKIELVYKSLTQIVD